MNKMRNAKFKIGQVVKHRLFPFRGVIFDIDPVFNNTEEWWQAIPAEVRPHKDQPFYHLFAENAETEYVAYVSEQNLLPDTSGAPVRHPAGRRGVRARRARRLSAAQQPVELISAVAIKRRGRSRAFDFVRLQTPNYFGGVAGGAAAAGCWASSFLRASSAFF